jgi:hypothetical protein
MIPESLSPVVLEPVVPVTAMVAHLLDQGLALIWGQYVSDLHQRRGDSL